MNTGLSGGSTKDQNAIHVQQYASIQQFRHQLVHTVLEMLWHILKAKGCHNDIEGLLPSSECSFKLVVFCNGNMIEVSQVELTFDT